MTANPTEQALKIPSEIPRELFLQKSPEEYCFELKQYRNQRRIQKYGEEATPFFYDSSLVPSDNMQLESLASEASLAKTKKEKSPKFESKNEKGSFSSPMSQALSVVALLVIGIACYSTYFGS